ncbi:amidophosphoribosyltransferase [Clostridium septicum]|uniref:Amidophosphoribosyltransferase n=1 Tax=Clostridium septicum TaxID=1504 RepID=A0A9N7JJV2_CLOSE|nr:amidophosphoribosyltransferase [Clostridium septicum]AYE33279.1 amidophosphoribosyltransferase [Clostridium septicum]MDU1312989.1 amidophosphoribosyltransferase [Clostridium septicum]QAS61450.1 amidophosphoribosyltransferase [Clostridium septicum]UEC22116.1 amidophosphoribosyltransferase [Clostridium septicum]USR99853.1 amidophosphoribosyltransferase [Clostridium septicum]
MNSSLELILDPSNDKFKDECGVFGVYANREMDVASMTYYGLYALQHRGQESAGIAVANGDVVNIHKGMGLITEAFSQSDLNKLQGNAAIGHVRYSTSGDTRIENAQPLLSKTKLGSIAMAHNGTLVNAEVIRELLEDGGHVFHTSIDSEVIANLIARGAKKGIERAVLDAIQAVRGSFAMVILTENKLIGVRDPHGIRPLCLGKFEDGYVLSSESCALDAIGAELVRDIDPGEIVVIDECGINSYRYSENTQCQTCAFEYIYFARPDSTIDGLDVHESRVKAGQELFKQYPIEADIVVAVPDSGIPAAIGYAKASGIPYDTGFVKNRYVGRTFITPSQEIRERAVAVKLNPLKVNIKDKKVVLIDDSIVRGTTSKHLVDSLKRAGAKEVHFLVASPIVKFPCYFGIDTPYRSELIGTKGSVDEIREMIGCDTLGYLDIENMYKCFKENSGYCVGCFNGVYPVATPIETAKDHIER